MATHLEPLPDDLAAAHAMILAQREQLALAKSEVTVAAGDRAAEVAVGESPVRAVRPILRAWQAADRQLDLAIEDLEETQGRQEGKAEIAAQADAQANSSRDSRAPRKPLPDHLPIERIVEPAPCACAKCGGL